MSYIGYTAYLPRLVIGGSVSSLRSLLSDCSHVLLLADAFLIKLGTLEPVFSQLKACDISYSLIERIPPEPSAQQVEEAVRLCRETDCDAILAIGGGSVLDTAKIASLLLENEKSVYDLLENPLAVDTRSKRLIVVPTTAGTGSEATPNAIVTDERRQLKIGIVNPALIPDAVLLDPAMTLSLPPAVTAATGMDALAHCLECYTSKKANPMSDTYAIDAMRLIFENLPLAYAQPENYPARHAMLYAAFLGGLCISTSSTTAVHALSYPLGGRHRIPHGVSNAMLLPHVMEFNADSIAQKLKTVAVRCLGYPCSISEESAAEAVILRLHALCNDMHIPQDLKQYGVGPDELEQLSAEGWSVKRLLNNNPKDMTFEDVKRIYAKLI